MLIPLDDLNEEDLNMRYVPLVGVRLLDREIEPWEQGVLAVARRLDPSDRDLWLTLGKRLERVSISPGTPDSMATGEMLELRGEVRAIA